MLMKEEYGQSVSQAAQIYSSTLVAGRSTGCKMARLGRPMYRKSSATSVLGYCFARVLFVIHPQLLAL